MRLMVKPQASRYAMAATAIWNHSQEASQITEAN